MDVTLIAALIAAIAAIISPLISAIISQRGARKLKSAELFFNAKSEAYSEFLRIASGFPDRPGEDDMTALNGAIYRCFLFSSEDTRSKIAFYADFLVEGKIDHENLDSFASAQRDALIAMQNELKQN